MKIKVVTEETNQTAGVPEAVGTSQAVAALEEPRQTQAEPALVEPRQAQAGAVVLVVGRMLAPLVEHIQQVVHTLPYHSITALWKSSRVYARTLRTTRTRSLLGYNLILL